MNGLLMKGKRMLIAECRLTELVKVLFMKHDDTNRRIEGQSLVWGLLSFI